MAVWMPVFGIFNMCTYVGVCNYTWGLYGHSGQREFALDVGSGRKMPCCIGDSNLHQDYICGVSLNFSWMLYQQN